MNVKIKKRHVWNMKVFLIICVNIALLTRRPLVLSHRTPDDFMGDDDITENSIKNGQAQYEMIYRDSNMPR